MRSSITWLKPKGADRFVSTKVFYLKRSKAGTRKPWRNTDEITEGSLEVAPNFDVLDVAEDPSVFDPSSSNYNVNVPIPPPAPLAMPNDYSVYYSKLRALRDPRTSMANGRSSQHSATAELLRKLNRNEMNIDSLMAANKQLQMEKQEEDAFYGRAPQEMNQSALAPKEIPIGQLSSSISDTPKIGFAGGDAVMAASTFANTPIAGENSTLKSAPTPLASIPFGNQLKLDVETAVTHAEPVPAALEHLSRTSEQKQESTKMPKSLNSLFHKIMGWNDELAELKRNDAITEESKADLTPQMAREEYKKMSEKLRYGALMQEYQNDQFALENRLTVSGLRFEKKFTDWAAMQVIDNAAQQDMEDVTKNKASVLMHSNLDFKIPRINHDCCKGCGATFQNNDKNQFGYIQPGKIEKYIQHHCEFMKRRSEYGDRMAELHAHWEKHGRRVGEEWLDFMTQDEFDAIYRYTPRPMVCDRCHALNTKKTKLIDMTLLSAPDFTKALQPLREKRCVVVLVCDITDFPGSMVYDLPALISMNNPVILVLNKLDCIQNRKPGYNGASRVFQKQQVPESYIAQWAREIATQFRLPGHRLKGIIPVSAHRGWNVERLVESIEHLSNMNLSNPSAPILPTYFVGVSNVGKSSLINSIAHKLYVPQPPHPQSRKVYFRKTNSDGKETIHWRWYTPPHTHKSEMLTLKSNKADKRATNLLTVSNLPGTTIATTGIRMSLSGNDKGASSTYLFDTPGLHPHWQGSSPLSLLDVRRSLQYNYRNPQCFVLKQGGTLLFAGVAAIDVVKASTPILFSIYSSRKAGHAIINTESSDAFWAQELGKKIGPPMSLEQIGDMRLTTKKSYLFECYHKNKIRPKADIYFCGLGWVAFNTHFQDDIVLRVRTLPGIVHGVREPLRINDIKARGSWPRLPSESKMGDKRIPRISKIIKLTATDVDLTSEPLKVVPRTVMKSTAVGDNKPFDDLMAELGALGKI